MINIFSNTFKTLYFKHLVGTMTQHFIDMVIVVESIEHDIKVEKIKGPTMSSRVMKKDEVESGFQIRNLNHARSDLIASLATPVSLSKIDILQPLKDVYQHLLNTRHNALTPSDPIQPPFFKWYNSNKKCEYHDRILGHSVENCKNFKYQVQKLVSKRQVKFVKDNDTYHIVTRPFTE